MQTAKNGYAPGPWGIFLASSCFFFFYVLFLVRAQEKGPKRRAPLGAGPVFPQIASQEIASVVALRPIGAIPYHIAERTSAEKPPHCNRAGEGLKRNASGARPTPFPPSYRKGELSSLGERLVLLPLSPWERGLGGEGLPLSFRRGGRGERFPGISVGATLVVALLKARILRVDIAGPYRQPVLAER